MKEYQIFSQIVALAGILLAAGCATRSDTGSVFAVVEHIQPEMGPMRQKENAITGITREISHIKSAVQAHRIPLIRGHAVSVVFYFAENQRSIDEVRLKVSYPAMGPNGSTRFTQPIDRIERPFYYEGKRIVDFVYVFDEEWELVPGKWHFEIWYGSTKLSEADAETYWPEPNSPVPTATSGRGSP